MRSPLVVAAGVLAVLCAFGFVQVARAGNSLVQVPSGYSPRVVLKVAYGRGPEQVRVDWGPPPGKREGWDPASVDALRVVGDRFYLLDRVADRVKVFREPAALVWESERFSLLEWYAVAPDHRAFVIWGDGSTQITCLADGGKVLWTRRGQEALPPAEELQKLGVIPVRGAGFFSPEWTGYGLVVRTSARAPDGSPVPLYLTLDVNGKPGRAFSGSPLLLSLDRTIYEIEVPKGRTGTSSLDRHPIRRLIHKSEAGDLLEQVILDFGTTESGHLKPREAARSTTLDPNGGFITETHVVLPYRVPLGISPRLHAPSNSTPIQKRLWRFHASGKLREIWGFPSPVLNRGYPPAVVAADGSVYYLKYGATGIEVIRYTKK